MASYYYLVASLPTLRYDAEAPMSFDQFLQACKGNVGPHHMALLEAATLADTGKPVPHNSFLAAWVSYRTMVAKELSDQRARKLDIVGDRYRNTGDKEYRIIETVRSALNAPDPLQGELMLMRLYWDFLDEQAGLHTFDMTALMAYAVKLQILERRGRFAQQAGNTEFKHLFSNLQSKIQSI